MSYRIQFATANAAFEDGEREEIATILRAMAEGIISTNDQNGSIRDANGNTIGDWSLDPLENDDDE